MWSRKYVDPAEIFRLGKKISGALPPKKIFFGQHIFASFGPTYFRDHMILGGFSAHGFLPMVFYFRLRNYGFGLIQVIGLGFWMSLAPICTLYCKQCNTMYEYNICWFSWFGFPGEKSLCNVCIYHCIFSVLF